MDRIQFNNRTYTDILLLTFAAFITRSVVFVSIGSFAPMGVTVFFGGLIFLGVFNGKSWVRRALKGWAFLLILFGVMRYALWALIYFTGIDEVHILEQFTILFNVFNILSISAGWYILRYTKKVLVYI